MVKSTTVLKQLLVTCCVQEWMNEIEKGGYPTLRWVLRVVHGALGDHRLLKRLREPIKRKD